MWTCFKLDEWKLPENTGTLKYCIWQEEACPDTGKHHYQGYMEYDTPVSMKAVKALFGVDMHLETRKGSQAQAIAYCSKEESRIDGPFEWGEKKNQGTRTDLRNIFDMVKAGKTDLEIAEEDPSGFIRYHRGIGNARFAVRKATCKDQRNVEVELHWGDPGTGKTLHAYDKYPDLYCLSGSGNSSLWFDGYDGEDTLLIDDFYGWIKWGQLLKLLDRYPLRLEVKGGHTWANWTRVLITSNKHYNDWYANADDRKDIRALERRIHRVFTYVTDLPVRQDK